MVRPPSSACADNLSEINGVILIVNSRNESPPNRSPIAFKYQSKEKAISMSTNFHTTTRMDSKNSSRPVQQPIRFKLSYKEKSFSTVEEAISRNKEANVVNLCLSKLTLQKVN